MISLLSLSLLITWWSVFIYRSIEDQAVQKRTILEYELGNIFHRMINDKDLPIALGDVGADHRFEVVDFISGKRSIFMKIPNCIPPLYLAVKKNVISGIEKGQQRQKLMVFGESGILAFVVLISIVFLFKFINLEKRSTLEMEEFWGRISHEIRTPIAGLKSFLESLKDGSISEEKLSGFIKLALIQVEKQERLAENILTGSSFKSNIKLNMEEFDLDKFLNLYLHEHPLGLSDKKIEHNYSEGDNLIVHGDKYALKIILDNIINNAEKYSSDSLILSIKTMKTNKSGAVIIKDNGPGFTSDCARNIFRAYKHIKEELPKTLHGTGMGLYISRKLARRMGGDISASSDGEGKGAVFRVELSLVR